MNTTPSSSKTDANSINKSMSTDQRPVIRKRNTVQPWSMADMTYLPCCIFHPHIRLFYSCFFFTLARIFSILVRRGTFHSIKFICFLVFLLGPFMDQSEKRRLVDSDVPVSMFFFWGGGRKTHRKTVTDESDQKHHCDTIMVCK